MITEEQKQRLLLEIQEVRNDDIILLVKLHREGWYSIDSHIRLAGVECSKVFSETLTNALKMVATLCKYLVIISHSRELSHMLQTLCETTIAVYPAQTDVLHAEIPHKLKAISNSQRGNHQ